MGELYIIIGLIFELVAFIKYGAATESAFGFFVAGAIFLVGGGLMRRMK